MTISFQETFQIRISKCLFPQLILQMLQNLMFRLCGIPDPFGYRYDTNLYSKKRSSSLKLLNR